MYVCLFVCLLVCKAWKLCQIIFWCTKPEKQKLKDDEEEVLGKLLLHFVCLYVYKNVWNEEVMEDRTSCDSKSCGSITKRWKF
jgi:hypothetical protein